MKDFKKLLLVIVLGLVLMVPAITKAAIKADFTGVSNGCQTPDSEGYCTSTAYLKIKATSASDTFTTISGTLSLIDSNSASGIKDVVISAASDKVSIQQSGSISSGFIIAITNNSLQLSTTEYTNVVKVTYKHLATMTTDCGLKFSAGDITAETPKETKTNTKTGASLPYAILGVAVVGAIAVLSLTSKKSKISKL